MVNLDVGTHGLSYLGDLILHELWSCHKLLVWKLSHMQRSSRLFSASFFARSEGLKFSSFVRFLELCCETSGVSPGTGEIDFCQLGGVDTL